MALTPAKKAVPAGLLQPIKKNGDSTPVKKKKKKQPSDLTWIENALKMLFVFGIFLFFSWIDVVDQKWVALACFGMLRYISRGWRRSRNKKEGKGTPQDKFFADKKGDSTAQ